MKWLRDFMTLGSKAKYLLWRLSRASQPVEVKLKTGEKLILRPEPADDLGVGLEVFAWELYKIPDSIDRTSIKHVVDIGANIGLTCLYWLRNFPTAHVVAFEPHPIHVKRIQLHLALNQCGERVTLIPAAAGIKEGETQLLDDGCRSSVTKRMGRQHIAVPIVDWIEQIKRENIDLLKIDIEGGEYEILADPRFPSLKIKHIVLEWHNTESQPNGQKWCTERLSQVGYQVTHCENKIESIGMLWAFRPDVGF